MNVRRKEEIRRYDASTCQDYSLKYKGEYHWNPRDEKTCGMVYERDCRVQQNCGKKSTALSPMQELEELLVQTAIGKDAPGLRKTVGKQNAKKFKKTADTKAFHTLRRSRTTKAEIA